MVVFLMQLIIKIVNLFYALNNYIQSKNGSLFVIKPFSRKGSPLNVPGVDIGISRDEIVDVLKEVRKR
jgi:hypothetical protein